MATTKNPKTAAEGAESTSVAAAPAVGLEAATLDTSTAVEAGQAPAQATAGAAPEGATEAAQGNSADIDPVPDVERCDVRVLAPVTIGCERFVPNDVIEGLPLALAKAHAGSVDTHPDAVDYARSTGSPVKPFDPLTE